MTARTGVWSADWRSRSSVWARASSLCSTLWASPDGRLLILALLGSASFALSIAATPHPAIGLLRNAWTPILLAGALVLGWMRPSRDIVQRVAAATLLLLATDFFIQWVYGIDVFGRGWQGPRLAGPLPHPNDAALVALLIPFVSRRYWSAAVPILVLSGSRNAILGVVVAAFLMATPKLRLALVTVCLLVTLAITGPNAELFTRGTARLGHWLVAAEMWKDAPVLGHGPASFVDQYLPRLDRLRPLPLGVDAEVSLIPWAHNLYLEQLAERGLLGLAAFLIPLGVAWRYGSASVRAAVAAFLVMGVFDLTLLKPWVVGAFWGLVALGQGEAT